jgi:hypothetical protein
MILFQTDWLRYPTARPDLDTPNKTFLRQALVYKSMGIKNHAFLLALIQPELKGVDPHSPNLTEHQKIMIGLECKYNPWYFFREVVRVPPHEARLRANRGNIGLFWAFLNNIDAALIQPRQTGKSVSTDCLMVWLLFIGAIKLDVFLLTKDDTLRQFNVERLKAIRDLLPPYLFTLASDDANNQKELTCNALENTYRTGVSQNSENSANNLGRGLTTPVLHCDEGPFISFIGTTLPAALAAGTAARDMAKEHGQPHGNMFTTTAGKKDDRDGRFMYDMIHQAATWDERAFFDTADRKRLLEVVKLNCSGRKIMVNITMSHKQLGYSDEWLYEKITEAAASGEAAERDFLNKWTSGTQRSPLSVKLNEEIHRSEQEVLHSEISRDGYILRWYVEEPAIAEHMAAGHFVIGLDMSDAVGRDAIALTMIDIRDGGIVAAGTYNETNLIRFGNYLTSLLIKYPTTTLVVERKSSAATLIDSLLIALPKAGIDPFRRIFNRIVDEHSERPDDYREICRHHDTRSEAFYDTRKKTLGFNTDAQSRNLLYSSVLQNAAKKSGYIVRDKVLSSELRGLVEKRGRIDHNESGHDDMVIAWLMCHWFLAHGRNLQHYGIPVQEVMADATETGREMSEEEIEDRIAQQAIMAEIDEVLDLLKESTDELTIMRYEHRLRVLNSRVKEGETMEASSLDAMIQGAAEERAKRLRIRSQQQRSGGHRLDGRPDFQNRGNRSINLARTGLGLFSRQ